MTISITFSNSSFYYPGGFFEGIVECDFDIRQDIQGINLKLRGCEHTSWEKWESYIESGENKTEWKSLLCSGDNTFLTIQETLHGTGSIDVGNKKFPFRLVLPKNIPSTYNGKHGNIRYYLKATVDILNGPNHEDEKIFVVNSPINFNDLLSGLELNPTQYQEESNLPCCSCVFDPITVDLRLEKEAFVLGEIVKVNLQIKNTSKECIVTTRVQLLQILTKNCTSPISEEKIETVVIGSDGHSGMGSERVRNHSVEFLIPSEFNLPNFASCKLFSQGFEIKVEVVIPGCFPNIKMKIPVIIGHIAVNNLTNIVTSTNAEKHNNK